LITRSAEGDTFELIGALSAVHAAAEHETYLHYLGRLELAALTIMVTEAGYLRGADGHLDAGRDVVASDIQALRSDSRGPVASFPAKLVAGLLPRRAAGAEPRPFARDAAGSLWDVRGTFGTRSRTRTSRPR
jgi:fructuronate reductase